MSVEAPEREVLLVCPRCGGDQGFIAVQCGRHRDLICRSCLDGGFNLRSLKVHPEGVTFPDIGPGDE